MTPETLLTELETVPYAQRIQRMIALGRQAQTDADAATLLRGLSEHDGFYERLLTLLSDAGSGDGAHILASLSDSSRLLRGLAARLTAAVATDEETASALTGASHKLRTTLLRGLLRKGRRGAIDPFLDVLASEGDERLGRLLPYGTEAAVRRHLPQVSERLGMSDWMRLARQHPDVALETIQERTETQTGQDSRLLSVANALLPELADSRPDAALTLVRDLLRFEPPSRIALQRLAERRPNEIADLLLASEDGAAARVNLSSFAHRLSEERLLALLEFRPSLLPYRSVWLKRLSPDMRRAAYRIAGNGWRTTEGILDAATVALLPGELRVAEARRNFALPALATRYPARLPYAAFLPWDEARAALEPSIKNPDATLRATALSALIGAGRYHRDRLPEVLALVRTRANEQDPVRLAMLTALATLPPARWQAEHLADLGQIVQDALNAADLSPGTARAAEKLLVSLVPIHPELAAPWLGTLVKSRGQFHSFYMENRLSDADVERIAPALLPVLQSWETRERETYLLHAAAGLGRRLHVFPGLVDILARVVTTTRQSYLADGIITLFAQHLPARLDPLVPSLLEKDPSVITLSGVYTYLHRKRQDLLTPFLGHQAYSGRFSTGKTRFVLPLLNGFHRWTPAQQTAFADTLTGVTHEQSRDTPALLRVISQLAALPAVPPTRLIELADKDNEKLAIRDVALRALARLDGGQGIPTLLEALDDARARIAIYALRSAILEMPAARALPLLQGVPTVKVTVAKEVIRLLGELETPDVYPVLLEMNARTLHRDVRVALLRAFWDHLESDDTWPILESAAQDADAAIAGGVVRIPTDRLSPIAQSRLLHLIGLLLEHPDSAVRLNALTRCDGLPLPDPARVLLPRLLVLLASPLPDLSAAAARALFAAYSGNAGQDAAAIGETASLIRDDRRVLLTLLGALHNTIKGNRTRLRPTVRAVLDALASDPLTARHRTELAIAGLPWDEITAYLSDLARTNDLHPEALMAAVHAIEGHPRNGDTGLATLETLFANDQDERLRRLGLAAVLAQSRATPGWTAELRTRLEAYRNDPAPLVAAAAQFTIPPPEEEKR